MGNGTYIPILFIFLLLLNLPKIYISSFTREMLCSLTLFPSGNYIGWDSKEQKEEFIQKGLYVPRNILPTRFQTYNDSVFLTLPRFRCGVPFSLGTVSFNDYCKAEPLMFPYPDWFSNRIEEYDAIHNAVDLVIDENKILWVLDVGIINTLTTPKLIDAPRVLGICMRSAKVTHVVHLSPLVTEKSRFQYLQVEVVQGKTFLYISDAGSNSIIVWDAAKGHGFKVLLPETVREGEHCVKNDVLYIVLLRGKCGGSTSLYITYLNAKKLYHIQTCNLRSGNPQGIVEEDGPKPGRIVLLGSDNGMTLFFRLKGKADIFMWDSNNEFHASNLLLAQPIESGRFPTHITAGYRHLIWTIESNFPDYMSDQVNEMGVSTKIHPTIKFCDEQFTN